MDYKKLSKLLSYILRHHPEKFNLALEPNGWVDIEILISILRKKPRWSRLTVSDIEKVMELSDKIRYEIKDNKIRAAYGHSIPVEISNPLTIPPEYLYHGTTKTAAEIIKIEGLKSCERLYVHLSQEKEIALKVGKRRDDNPVLIKVMAAKAFNDKIAFYKSSDGIWLSDDIPSKYLIFELS